MDNSVTIRNRHTGEILRLSRVRDAQGQIVLNLDGSLPPRAGGPPLHVHFYQREEGQVKAGTLGAQVRKDQDSSASRGDRSLCRRHSSQMVERGRRSLGVQRPGNSCGRLGSLPTGGVCGGQRQPERSAIDLLYGPRAVAAPQLTVACDSAPSHSAHRFPCHSVHRARPGQIPRIELARFPRVVSRCAARGRRERLGVRRRSDSPLLGDRACAEALD